MSSASVVAASVTPHRCVFQVGIATGGAGDTVTVSQATFLAAITPGPLKTLFGGSSFPLITDPRVGVSVWTDDFSNTSPGSFKFSSTNFVFGSKNTCNYNVELSYRHSIPR